jgi:thymidylate synthase
MNNLDKQYQQLLQDILEYGVEKKDRTGTGTKSIFGYTVRHKMSEGFPLLTTKKMHWSSIVTELLWFLKGDTNIKYLVDNGCNIWNGDAYKNYEKLLKVGFHGPWYNKEKFIDTIKTNEKFAKDFGNLGPIYGKQWRNWNGIDQIQNLINDLKTNPDSRRLMVSAWNVGELNKMVLPPCHYGFQVYTREDKSGKRYISLMWNQRSVDTFLGLPFNIASYALLLEILAKEVNMIPDQLIGNLGDVHLYNDHIDQAKEQITRSSFELPKLLFKDHLDNYSSIIDILRPIDFILDNYQSHPTIKAPLSN